MERTFCAALPDRPALALPDSARLNGYVVPVALIASVPALCDWSDAKRERCPARDRQPLLRWVTVADGVLNIAGPRHRHLPLDQLRTVHTHGDFRLSASAARADRARLGGTSTHQIQGSHDHQPIVPCSIVCSDIGFWDNTS